MTTYLNKTVSLLMLTAAVIGVFSSCEKEEEFPTVAFNDAGLYFEGFGEEASIGFVETNVSTISVTKIPKGWTAVADLSSHTVIIASPQNDQDGNVSFGTVTISGVSEDGKRASANLYVSIVDKQELTERSNTYMVHNTNTMYIINAGFKGEDEDAIELPSSAAVVWQYPKDVVNSVRSDGDKILFYVGVDENGDTPEGNALIASYDANGKIIWTWQIWVTAYDPNVENQTYANGKTFMLHNLGAAAAINDTKENILASYGTYYQWGRREPFVQPKVYNAAKGEDAIMYNGVNRLVEYVYAASTAEIGTEVYARENPLVYILGVGESNYDWLYSAHSSALWGEVKTINDPCPKGWRVPSKNDFAGLTIKEDLALPDAAATYAEKYGWTLTDGTVDAFYPAAGRKTYKTGKIQNIYNPLPKSRASEAQPWEGLYWTTGAEADNYSSAFYFWFDFQNTSASGVKASVPYQRANGMQIRCVKI